MDDKDKVTEYVSTTEITRTLLAVLRNHQIFKEDMDKIKEIPDPEGVAIFDSGGINEEATEDSILGDLFSQRSVGEDERSYPSKSKTNISKDQFFQSVLLLKGLVSLLSQHNNPMDKLNIIHPEVLGYSQQDDNCNIVFGLLTFVSDFLFSDQDEDRPDSLWMWMREGVSAVIALTNENMSHMFIDDVREISKEFMLSLLHGLTEVGKDRQDGVLKILSMFGANKDSGRILVDFLVNKFIEISDLLREAERFKIKDDTITENFEIFYSSLTELWPNFVQGKYSLLKLDFLIFFLHYAALCETRTIPPGSKRKSGAVRPRLSLSETTKFVEEMERWSALLLDCTHGLSICQPEFFMAVTKVQQFIKGAIQGISKQKI